MAAGHVIGRSARHFPGLAPAIRLAGEHTLRDIEPEECGVRQDKYPPSGRISCVEQVADDSQHGAEAGAA